MGHASWIEELAAMLGLKHTHSSLLPLSSIEGTKERKLVLVIPSSETVSEKGSIARCPFCHLITADGFEPEH
jgi:hypothetical protein